jgi:Choline/ethanolamine kinase
MLKYWFVCFMQVLSSCFTNKLIMCRAGSDQLSDDCIIVRIFGRGTELFVDREKELDCMLLLHDLGISNAQVYCTFNGGIAYSYLPGVMLNCRMVFQPHIQRYGWVAYFIHQNFVWC